MKTGLVSVSFRDHTPEEIVGAALAAGLSVIEWGSDVHAPKGDRLRLEKTAALCRKQGVRVFSYGTYFRLGETPFDQLNDYLDAAAILGAGVLRLWCGTKGYENYTPDEWQMLITECRRAAALAAEKKVTLCMECHQGTVTDCVEGALRLMREVDSSHFLMYWQPNQDKTVEENCRYAEKIAPYTKAVHVFNWKGEDRLPLGEAVETWREYLKPFSKDITCLLEFMPDGRLETLPREGQALKTIVEENR